MRVQPLSLTLRLCWPWSRRCSGCGMRGAVWLVRGVGHGVSGYSKAPSSTTRAAVVPPWEAFPEVNRVAVRHLLGLLVEKAATLPASRGGGERGGHADQAVATTGEQDPTAAS